MSSRYVARCFPYEFFTDYIDDIMENELKMETKVRRRVIGQAPQLEYRRYLIELMQNICERRRFSRCTLHLGCYYLDVFMDNHSIAVDRLNLVAIVSLILAAKVEDCDPLVPKMTEIHTFVNITYEAHELASVERMLLRFFGFKLLIPTAATFVEVFIESAIDDWDLKCLKLNNEKVYNKCTSVCCLKKLFATEVFIFLDISLLSLTMTNVSPSLLASAVLAAARISLKLIVWPALLQKITQYQYENIRDTVKELGNMRKYNEDGRKNTPESGYLTDPNDQDTDSVEDEVSNQAKKQCL